MRWGRFIRTAIATFAVLVVLVYALILLVDPYRNVPFSLPLERAPISTNQRFAYPALARDPSFDSVIIGSSTVRLLNPENLDQLTGARFANLAMNSATAYEQMKIHDLFMRHHPGARYVIVGIDDSWCRRETSYEKYTFRAFPQWMYDDNPWNDLLYLFNDKALENTVRLLEYVTGHREAKYETNGYRDFTADTGTYDSAGVSRRLYPQGPPSQRRAPDVAPRREQPDWRYASHELLDELLGATPEGAVTLLLFAPMHGYYLQRGEALYRECKARILEIADRRHVGVMDYMIDSPITRVDDNYWDPLHFTARIARDIEGDIAARLSGERRAQERYISY